MTMLRLVATSSEIEKAGVPFEEKPKGMVDLYRGNGGMVEIDALVPVVVGLEVWLALDRMKNVGKPTQIRAYEPLRMCQPEPGGLCSLTGEVPAAVAGVFVAAAKREGVQIRPYCLSLFASTEGGNDGAKKTTRGS